MLSLKSYTYVVIEIFALTKGQFRRKTSKTEGGNRSDSLSKSNIRCQQTELLLTFIMR